MKLTITRHTDTVWRYRWELANSTEYVDGNFAITIWGARWAARKALKRSMRPKPKGVGETVFEEEI